MGLTGGITVTCCPDVDACWFPVTVCVFPFSSVFDFAGSSGCSFSFPFSSGSSVDDSCCDDRLDSAFPEDVLESAVA